jgi:hypothetical protein
MRALLLSLITLALIGCASTAIIRSPEFKNDPKVSANHHIFFWGFWEASPPYRMQEACGAQNWSAIHTHYSIVNILVGAVTLGVYTPVTIDVHCMRLQSRR